MATLSVSCLRVGAANVFEILYFCLRPLKTNLLLNFPFLFRVKSTINDPISAFGGTVFLFTVWKTDRSVIACISVAIAFLYSCLSYIEILYRSWLFIEFALYYFVSHLLFLCFNFFILILQFSNKIFILVHLFKRIF